VTTLESCYRRLLRAYPPAYRRAHGEEILGTLMEASEGRERPSVREAASLIGGGLTARVRRSVERPVPWWADGLHLGIFLTALSTMAPGTVESLYYGFSTHGAGWIVGSTVLVLALWRGWVRTALPLALIGAFLVGRPPFGLAYALPGVGSTYGSWGLVGPYPVVAAGLVILAVGPSRRLRPRSLWWLAVPVIAIASAHLNMQVNAPFALGWAVPTVTELLLLSAGVWATAVVRDLRWLLSAAIFIVPGNVPLLYFLLNYQMMPSVLSLVVWGVEAALLLAMAAAAYRARRACA
jgi:hypothetical protein